MRLLKRITLGMAALAAATLMPATTQAATLAFTHVVGGSNTYYTLEVATGCSTCAVTLTIEYEDPAGAANNAFAGAYLDSVQWRVDSYGVADESDIGYNDDGPGGAGAWDFGLGGLNANQCNTASKNPAVCGEWVNGGTAGGFGPIVNGSTLTWTFLTDFGVILPVDLGDGNIRAAYNTADGKNFAIFSPGGGGFGGEGGGGGGIVVPEPITLALLGMGLLGAGYRRRRLS